MDQNSWKKFLNKKVKNLYRTGTSILEIKRQFAIDQDLIYKILKRAGIKVIKLKTIKHRKRIEPGKGEEKIEYTDSKYRDLERKVLRDKK